MGHGLAGERDVIRGIMNTVFLMRMFSASSILVELSQMFCLEADLAAEYPLS
jgi:hypothetical protein